MGAHKNITAERFPRQGKFLGKVVDVCFHYDTSAIVRGKVIRDDAEAPGELIILLDDERVVKATECQYSFPNL